MPDPTLQEQERARADWRPLAEVALCDVRRVCIGGTRATWYWPGEGDFAGYGRACDHCKELHERDYPEKLARHELREAQSRVVYLAVERLSEKVVATAVVAQQKRDSEVVETFRAHHHLGRFLCDPDIRRVHKLLDRIKTAIGGQDAQ